MPLQRQNPKNFYVCVCMCAESDVSGVLSSDNDLPTSGNSGEAPALHLQLSPSGSGPPDPAGKVIDSLSLVAPASMPNSLVHSSSLQSLASNHSQSQPLQPRSSAVSHSARINLDSKSPVPASTRKIFLSPTQSSKKLTHLNPCLLKKDIDSLCGPVTSVEYLQSGNLLITACSSDQVTLLLGISSLPSLNVSVTAKIAWSQQFTYGKLYAPALSHESLDTILEYLSPHGVVAVRKLNPKVSAPLYVLTFLGPVPSKLTLGYMQYNIDKYVSRPLRCFTCWRLRHSSTSCRSKPACSNCTSPDHTADSCSSLVPRCINCRGMHASTSLDCPLYQKELSICTLQADLGISFLEARSRIEASSLLPRDPRRQTSPLSSSSDRSLLSAPALPLSSASEFPPLPSTTHQVLPSCSLRSSATSQSLPLTSAQPPASSLQPLQSLPYSSNFSLSSQLATQQPSTSGPSQLSLPPLSPPTLSHLPDTPCLSPLSAVSDTSSATPSFLNLPLSSLLPKLLPVLIKILFAATTTDKIEYLTELGSIFQMGSLVTSILASLNISSHSSL